MCVVKLATINELAQISEFESEYLPFSTVHYSCLMYVRIIYVHLYRMFEMQFCYVHACEMYLVNTVYTTVMYIDYIHIKSLYAL